MVQFYYQTRKERNVDSWLHMFSHQGNVVRRVNIVAKIVIQNNCQREC
jgi:hypothetical protein